MSVKSRKLRATAFGLLTGLVLYNYSVASKIGPKRLCNSSSDRSIADEFAVATTKICPRRGSFLVRRARRTRFAAFFVWNSHAAW